MSCHHQSHCLFFHCSFGVLLYLPPRWVEALLLCPLSRLIARFLIAQLRHFCFDPGHSWAFYSSHFQNYFNSWCYIIAGIWFSFPIAQLGHYCVFLFIQLSTSVLTPVIVGLFLFDISNFSAIMALIWFRGRDKISNINTSIPHLFILSTKY